MDILGFAREDINMILNEGGFEVDITFESPSFDIAQIKGLAITRNNMIEADGQVINANLAHVSVAEKDLIALSYPLTNVDGKPKLVGHKVTYANSNGDSITYKVNETLPSRTVGVISLILGEYEPTAGYNPLADSELVMYYDFSGLVINSDNSFGTVDAGGRISNWKNLKGTTVFDLVQSVTTQQPLLDSNFIECDGVNDLLETVDLPVEIKNLDDFTFVVIGESSAGSQHTVFQGADSQLIAGSISGALKATFNERGGISEAITTLNETTGIPDNSLFINFFNYKINWDIVSNGNSVLSGNSSITKDSVVTNLIIGKIINGGSTTFRTTKIKSILVYKNEQTGQKLIDINTFLTDKYT